MDFVSQKDITLKLKPNPRLVSIEKQNALNDLEKKLKSKGQIRKGPNWTAYNRENLGSIPGKVENIIINDKIDSTKLGFLSNTLRFQDKSTNAKKELPGPGKYLKEYSCFEVKQKVFSAKGLGNGFISQTPRFSDYEEFISKYAPGPSDYTTDISTISQKTEKSIKYKSIYSSKEKFSLKETKETPGPGFYESSSLLTEPNTFEETKNSCFFKSTSKRFQSEFGQALNKEDDYYNNYNKTNYTNASNLTNYSSNNITYTNFNTTYNGFGKAKMLLNRLNNEKDSQKNKTLYQTPLSKSKIEEEMILIQENAKNAKVSSNCLPSLKGEYSKYNVLLNNASEASIVKGPMINHTYQTVSHFFQAKSLGKFKFDPLHKYGIGKERKVIKEAKETVYMPSIQNNDFYKPNIEFLRFQREAIKSRVKSRAKKKKQVRKNDYYLTYSCFNLDKVSKQQNSIFSSQSPKTKEVNNKNPGPCYYSPKVSPSKTTFNINKTKTWIPL